MFVRFVIFVRFNRMKELTRSIGIVQATAMVVGTIVGSSIFVQPSEVSRAVPNFGGMLLVWVAAGALTWFGASICAELASAIPRTGGVYVYLRDMFSPSAGFLWGWAMFWSMHSGIIAAIAMVFGRYTATLVPLSDLGIRLVAVGGILILTVINYVGVRPGSAVQTGLTIAKIAAVTALIVLLFGAGSLHAPTSATSVAPRSFLRALVAGLFAFGGWHMVTYAAEETRDAERTIPRALMLGTAVVVVIYLLLNAAYLLVLPLDAVLKSTHIAFDATTATVGPRTASAISILVIVSSFGAMSGIVLAGPRVYYAMAEDGLLFQWMGALHPRYRTPYLATVVQGIWSSILVLTGTYGVIVSRVVYTEWIFFGALALGVIKLRRSRAYSPAFRAFGFPVVPILFALTCLAIVVNQIASDPRESLTGLALVLVGLPVYFVWRSFNGRDRLSQSLLPAEIHAGAAVRTEQRQGDDR
ncbi:MAG TPA: amino acid permease [Vicinamibacterales bacterium]|nr:amino acid permease [Vicinamibacterales bacterium]